MALTTTQVSQLYVSIFNRASEGSGNAYWVTNGSDMASTATTMLATDDALAYLGDLSNERFIETIYANTLNKSATDDPDGIAYWTAELDGGKSRGVVIATIITAIADPANAGDAADQFINRVSVSDFTAATLLEAPADYAVSLQFLTTDGEGTLDVTNDIATVTAATDTILDLALGPVAFTLTSDAASDQVLEGDAATYTVTANQAVREDTDVVFNVVVGDAAAADAGTSDTNLADFGADAIIPSVTVTILAGETTASFAVTGNSDDIAELPEAYSVTADIAGVEQMTANTSLLDVPNTFTLTSDADSVLEGDSSTFTVTARVAVTEDTVVTFNVVPGDTSAADQGTSDTNLNDFAAGTFNPSTVTILAGATTATFNATGQDDDLTELPENYSVTADITGQDQMTKTISLLDGSGTVNLTLTTGLDNFTGTNGDNTFTAVEVNAAGVVTPTWSIGDNINGAGGTDTLNVLQTAAIAAAPVGSTVSNIENVSLTSGATIELNTVTSGAGFSGLTSLTTNSIGGATLTVAATTAVTATDTLTGAALIVAGGSDVTATLNGVTTGGTTTAIGTATTAGAIVVNVNEINTAADAGSTLAVTGGTTQTVTSTQTSTAVGVAGSTTGGSVTSTGGAVTTAVTVEQATAVLAVAAVAAVTENTTLVFSAEATAGDVITIGGLTATFTGIFGVASIAQQVAIFANLSDGANASTTSVAAAAAAVTGGAVITGTFTGFTTGAVSGPNTTVVATSTIGGTDVATIAFTSPNTAKVAGTTIEGRAAVDAVNGVINGAVGVTDVNAASTTAAGVITTVSLNDYGVSTINSGALTTVNLSGTSGTVGITTGALTTAAVTTLGLNLNGLSGITLADNAITVDADITTLNIGSSTAASTVANITATGATTVNVTGDALLTLTDNTFAAATAINVTNTAGASFGLTAMNVGATFTGGAGADSAIFGLSTTTNTLGGGNDTAELTAATLGTGGTLVGGNGTDTLSMTGAFATTASIAGAAVTAFTAAVNGFENLTVTGNASTINVAALLGATNASNVTVTGANVATTLNGLVTSGTGATVNITGDNARINLTGTSGSTTDIVNLNLNNDGVVPDIFGILSSTGVQTFNVTTNDTQTIAGGIAHLNTLTILDAGAKSINVSGNEGLALTHAGTVLTSFDATGTSGNVTYTTDALSFAASLTGGAGDDTINAAAATAAVTIVEAAGTNILTGSLTGVNTITGGTGVDIIVGGNVVDTINGGGGADFITGGNGADILAGGTGADTFVYGTSATQLVTYAGADTTDANIEKITDFTATSDTVSIVTGSVFAGVTTVATTGFNLNVINSGTLAATPTAIAAGAASITELTTLFETAIGGFGIASNNGNGGNLSTGFRVYTFATAAGTGAFDGKTYAVINDTAVALTADDVIIDITGISGSLSAADFAMGSAV